MRPKPLLTGRELIAAGYTPGAGFKEMLRAAEDAQLEGAIATAEEALRLGAGAVWGVRCGGVGGVSGVSSVRR